MGRRKGATGAEAAQLTPADVHVPTADKDDKDDKAKEGSDTGDLLGRVLDFVRGLRGGAPARERTASHAILVEAIDHTADALALADSGGKPGVWFSHGA